MQIAENYFRLPKMLRKSLIELPVGLIPTSELKKSRVRDAKRFLQAASLPKTERYFRWMSTFNRDAKLELYTKDFTETVAAQNPSAFLDKWFAKANGAGILDTTLLTDQMTYLPNDLLVKVDIASMANSLEARSPFLDHKVIEFAASLPENLKLRGLTTKYLLKRVLGKLLPTENLKRPKMGFGVPVGHWFRGPLEGFLRETVLSDKAARRGLFRPEVVRRYVDEHTAGRADYAHQLWTLLMLELWFNLGSQSS